MNRSESGVMSLSSIPQLQHEGLRSYFAHSRRTDLIFYPQATKLLEPEEISGGNRTYKVLTELLASWGMSIGFDITTHLPRITLKDQLLLDPSSLSKNINLEVLLNEKAIYVHHAYDIPVGVGCLVLVDGKVHQIGTEQNYTDGNDRFVLYNRHSYSVGEYQKLPAVRAEIRRLNAEAHGAFVNDNRLSIILKRRPDIKQWELYFRGDDWDERHPGILLQAEEAFVSYSACDDMGRLRLSPNDNFYLVAYGKYIDGFRDNSQIVWKLSRTKAERTGRPYSILPTTEFPTKSMSLEELSAICERVTIIDLPR